jgi:arylformamidase
MSNIHPWIDVSVPLHTGMVHWPGDPEPTFERISEIELGADANVTLCRMTAHTGTHMDAPRHFLADGVGIDQFPLEVAIGQARVIAMPSDCAVVSKAELEPHDIAKGERILLRTRNSQASWHDREFQPGFVGINASGAQYLADRGVSLIGVDYLSVGVFEGDGKETHQILLSAGVWIVEGLTLGGIEDGLYDLICLPLRIGGVDGSPARVVLRAVSSNG